MQQANRRTVKAGQDIDHAACRQMDRKGKQEMDHSACRQMYRGRTGENRAACPHMYKGKACWQMNRGRAGMDRKSRTGDGTGSRQTDRSRGGQIESKGRQMMLHAATISDT